MARNTKGRQPRNLEPFKAEIMEMRKQKLSIENVRDSIFREHEIHFGIGTLKKAIREWSPVKPRIRKNGTYGYLRKLEPYKAQILAWDGKGLDAAQIILTMDKTLNKKVKEATVASHLAFWKNSCTWRQFNAHPSLDAEEALTFIPVDWRSADELQEMHSALKTAYLADFAKDQGRRRHLANSIDLELWSQRLTTATCYDPTMQALMVKEHQQPGHHWKSKRLFDHLWVDGIQLPGSYSLECVNTREKIMEVIDSLTYDILEKVYATLKGFLDQAIACAVKEYGQQQIKHAKSLIPCTTPAKCVATLLRRTRSEIEELQQEIQLRESLESLSLSGLPGCNALLQDLKLNPPSLLVDRFTDVVFEELQQWREPWMRMGKLPELTKEHVNQFLDSATEPSENDEDSEDDESYLWNHRSGGARKSRVRGTNGDKDANQHKAIGQEDHRPARRPNVEQDGNAQSQNGMDNDCDFFQPHSCYRYVILLQDRVRLNIPDRPLVFRIWKAPTSGALSGCPPARFSSQSWEPDHASLIADLMGPCQPHLLAQDVLLVPTTTENKLASGSKGAALDSRGPGTGRKLQKDRKSTTETLQQKIPGSEMSEDGEETDRYKDEDQDNKLFSEAKGAVMDDGGQVDMRRKLRQYRTPTAKALQQANLESEGLEDEEDIHEHENEDQDKDLDEYQSEDQDEDPDECLDKDKAEYGKFRPGQSGLSRTRVQASSSQFLQRTEERGAASNTGRQANPSGEVALQDRASANDVQRMADARNLIARDSFLPLARDHNEAYEEAISYAKTIISSRTGQEKAEYERVARRMMDCTSRPHGAETLPIAPGWSAKLRDDNWWHCRRLLQILAKIYGFSNAEYTEFEVKLLLVLAAVEAGTTEAVLWFIPLEGLLRRIWVHTKQCAAVRRHTSTSQSQRYQLLLRELVAFSYGVALTNISLRFHWRRLGPDLQLAGQPQKEECWNVQRWYTMLIKSEPRCSNPECLLLLPNPRSIALDNGRETISVGAVISRTGSRSTRSFISTNRRDIFPCLVGWLRYRDPHPALICAFLFYGALFHTDVSCKAGRGKWRKKVFGGSMGAGL